MTTGRINQVSYSLTGPAPFSRPPTRRALQRDRPATVQPRLLLPPSLSALLHHRQCPESPAHQGPATPAIPLTGHQRVSQPASRPDQLTLNTHATPRPSTPLLDGSRPSRSHPVNHVNRSQPACPSLAVYPRIHGLVLVVCATPSRTDPTALRHRSRVTYPLASSPLCTRSCGAVSAIANPRQDQSSSTTPSDRLPVESPGRTRHRPVSRLLHAPAQLLHVAVLLTVPAAPFTAAVSASLSSGQRPCT